MMGLDESFGGGGLREARAGLMPLTFNPSGLSKNLVQQVQLKQCSSLKFHRVRQK